MELQDGEAAKESVTTDSLVLDSIPQDASFDGKIIQVPSKCELEGKKLDGNQFFARDAQRLIAITATDDTKTEDGIESHRTLEVYDSENCERIRRGKLPLNISADYPYYLAQINYNNNSELLGIRGVNDFYIYDIENDKLQKLEPQYPKTRAQDEPSSGRLLRLEIWEDYLIGYAETSGAFVFDLSDKSSPKPVLPLVDYAKMDDTYSCLFCYRQMPKNKLFKCLFLSLIMMITL